MTEPTAAPPLFRRHVRRPRLTALLDESTAQAIVLTAPAGYGKTVLAQEWLTGRPSVAWYRASPASADVAAFSAGVAEAVAPIVPNAGDRLKQRLRVADTPEKLVRPLAELLAEDLASWPDDAWLVVDDYHLVTDSAAVEEFVDWLLTLAPVRLLVTTRRRPSWASARRVLYGEISEIGRDQLAMTNEEASRVLDGRSSDAVRALVAQAGGWPALIGLAALSTSSELPTERVSDALFRYFAEEVLRREPAEVQRFMLMASIPASLNLDVAHDVLGVADAEPLLGRLSDEGLLHESDDGLRFHPLVRDFLRRKFEFEEPELVARLRERAIADAQRRERWEEAFSLAFESGRLETAAAIAGDAAPALLASGRMEILEKWLSVTDVAAFHNASAVLARADVLIRKGRFSEALMLTEGLADRLPIDDRFASRAWFLAGQALHLQSDASTALAHFLKAKEAAQATPDRKRAIYGSLLAAAELELDSMLSFLNEFEDIASDDIDDRLRVAAGRLNVASKRGSLAGIWSLFEPLVPLMSKSIDPMARSAFLMSLGYLHLGAARYAAARDFAAQGLGFCRNLRLDFATGYCLAVHAGADIGLRKLRAAERTLDELTADDSHLTEHLVLERLIENVRLALTKRQFKLAVETEQHLPAGEIPREQHGAYFGLLAIAHCMVSDIETAQRYADDARRLTGGVQALYYSQVADLLVATRLDGPSALTRSAAADLFNTAAHADFLDALVVGYRAHPPLLDMVAGDARVAGVLTRLARATGDHALAAATGLVPAAHESLHDLLTRREEEVLALMAKGLSNAEIAHRLVISTSTAKVHVHHILKKLGARTRLDAVLAARESRTD